MERTGQGLISKGRISILFFIAVGIILITAIAFTYYRIEKDNIRREKYEAIASIAGLKVKQIESWRSERIEDVRVLATDPYTIRAVLDLLEAPAIEKIDKENEVRQSLQVSLGLYERVFVLDTNGRTIVSTQASFSGLGTAEREAFDEVVSERRPSMTDLFKNSKGIVCIDAMDAILGRSGRVRAVVVLRADADSLLYPLIDSWPIPSRTSETVLIERKADQVVFLNNLRFQSGTALSLKLPLTMTMVPAAQAVLGKVGMFEGKDYRGERVLADLRPVPNTPWYMVTKVDESEILSEANYRGRVAILFVFLFIVISIISTAYAYRHRQASIYREMYHVEVERKEVQEELKATLYSIGDGVITTDINGVVKQMNPEAERLIGWTEQEAKGKPLDKVFRIVNENTHSVVESPVRRVISVGNVIGLANHTLLVSRDGTEHPIADSGSPIRDDSGTVTGVVFIFRDQTKEREAERRVNESESRLANAEIASKSGNWELHLDSQTMVASKGALRIYGLKKEKIEYAVAKAIPLPEYRQMMDKALKNLLEKDELYDIYFKIKASDTGETKDIHSIALFDSDRKVVFGVIQDVTDIMRTQEALRLSEENYREIFNSTDEAIFIDDALTGRMLDVNEAVLKMYGYGTKEEILSGNIGDLSAGRDGYTEEKAQEYIRKSIVEGTQTFEWLARRKDGTTFWIEITLRKTEIGGMNRILAVGRDVTERKHAEIALRESEERFRGLVEGSSAAIWIHDGQRFLYANPAALELSGYTAEELYKMAPMEIVHPDFRELVKRRSEERMHGTKTPKHYEYQILKKSGEPAWIDFSGASIDYQGRSAIIASAYDISDRKKLEEQLFQAQKMESIGRLAGGVAHDYNNMLGVIIGYSDLLIKKMAKADPARRSAEMILAAAKRAADITRQLLAFARREIVSPRVLNPNDEINSLLEMLQRLIGEDKKLKFMPAKDLWNIKIDRTQFDQILVNLSTNARDALEGVGTITIETSEITIDEAYVRNNLDFSPGEYVLISFTDSGTGMSEETRNRSFEPFFTTKAKGQGSGLGLSTIYGIVKQNGGNINVYSELGMGSTFRIYLPRAEGDVESLERIQEEEPINGTETILIVEDQADLLEIAKKCLQEYGYKVLTALSPGEGIRLCESYPGEIHLLLTNVVMPVMNGKELRNRIQAIKPSMKAIFMSGYTADIIAHEGVLDEGVDFVQKPFTPKGLAKKVREVLEG